jgi:hypothetical protein
VEAAALAPHLQRLIAFCLSPAIAEAARRVPWGDVRVATRPEEEALLAAVEAARRPRPA